MKSFLKFLAIVTGVLLLSVILAPLLFKFLPFKFEKIFNRLVMIFSLASIALFVRFDRSKLTGYGIHPHPRAFSLIAAGFWAGVITLFVLTLLKIAVGNAVWDLKPFSSAWILKPLGVFFTAFLIGVIEEFFFRGIIFKTLTDKFRWNIVLAVIGTSIFYSLLHFVHAKKPFIGQDPGFADSLKLLMAPFASMTQWQEIWRGGVGLFIFGVVLNILAIRTKSLFASIGLHAGCVFFVKLDGFFVRFSNDAPLLWGSAKMYDSVMGWIFLALMGVGLSLWIFRTLPESQSLTQNSKK